MAIFWANNYSVRRDRMPWRFSGAGRQGTGDFSGDNRAILAIKKKNKTNGN